MKINYTDFKIHDTDIKVNDTYAKFPDISNQNLRHRHQNQ